MTNVASIERMDPVLELWIDDRGTDGPVALRCAGTLDDRTRPSLLSALDDVLDSGVQQVIIDVTGLEVCDVSGANTLGVIQRSVFNAGRALAWEGLDIRHLTARAPAVRSAS